MTKMFLDKKIASANLNHFKIIREEARNKRATLDGKNTLLDELQQNMSNIERDMKPLVKRYNEILYIEENLSTLKNKLLTSEGNLRSIRSAQKELKLIIKFKFEGSDSELLGVLKNFNDNLL